MALFGRPTEKDEARAVAYREWFRRQHPYALVSLLLSVFSLTHLGVLLVDELAGIALGAFTLVQLRRTRGDAGRSAKADTRADADARTEGDWMAWGGVGVGVLSLVTAGVVYSMR